MYSGGPPVFLMWSGMFNPDKAKLKGQANWRRIRALFRPYRKEELKVLACISVSAVVGLVPPLMVAWLVDRALPHKSLSELFTYVGTMAGAAILLGLIGVYQGLQNHRMGEGIMRDLRISLVTHLHRLPLEFFTGTKTGEIVNRVSTDVDSVDDLVSGTLVTIVSNFFVMISTIIAMLVMDWRLTLISLAVLPFMIFPLWPIGQKMYVTRKANRKKRDELASIIQETLSISGITLLKIFGREEGERKKFATVAGDLMKMEIDLAMIGRWFFMLMITMAIVGPALIWLFGGYFVIKGELGLGTVTAFVALLSRLYTPVSSLSGVQVQIASALAVFERIFEYLDMDEENLSGTKELPEEIKGQIIFDHVSFNYLPERPTLEDVSFTIAPSRMLAVVGHSGAGKSTIASLIPRFYEVTAGEILLDGVNTRDYKLKDLRAHIGMVTQETYLFHDTVEANLRYAKPDATQEEIENAAKLAQIHDVILGLSEGYQTTVGERGYKLSGGERQRLSIARVILKNPKILILDEATSALDSVSEEAIQNALSALMQGRTSLVIAHRLSTVEKADQIIVVDKGRIVETGTHSQLLQQGGAYALLAARQFKTLELESST